MRRFIAMDADGTSQWGSPPGPITLEQLLKFCHDDIIMMIGNPQRSAASPFVVMRPDDREKSLALRQAREAVLADEYIVVDDCPDQYHGGWEGWVFMSPQEFVDKVLK